MKKILELIGIVLVIQGIAGVVHEFTGWFGLWTIVPYLGFLDGNEIFANIVLAVLGGLMLAVSDSERVGRV